MQKRSEEMIAENSPNLTTDKPIYSSSVNTNRMSPKKPMPGHSTITTLKATSKNDAFLKGTMI